MKNLKNVGHYPCFFAGAFTPGDSRRCRRFRFFVPPGAGRVSLWLSYSPRHEGEAGALSVPGFRERWAREIERYRAKVARAGDSALAACYERFIDEAVPRIQPLHNLLNLAVFDSSGAFRGRWDSPQHFARWVAIGETGAERGFIAGPLPAGEWEAVLECHTVVTDACAYQLAIECAPGDGAWYRGELHAHTNHSDGALSPGELVAAAAEAGLDFIAVTDHNTVSGLAALAPPGPDPRPLVIPGMELTTFYGHAVALGTAEFIPWHDAGREGGLNRQAAETHRRGGLFSIAHPFSVGYPVCAGCEWEYEGTDLRAVDLVEVWSGPWAARVMCNLLALRWWDEMLCRGYRVTGVAARDVHRRADLGQKDTADTYVWARSLAPADILEGLRAGRVWLSSGPELSFSMQAEGGSGLYLPGDRARVRRGGELAFSIEARERGETGGRGLVARVVRGVRGRGAAAVHVAPLGDDGRAGFREAATDDAWYRCEVARDGGTRLPGPCLAALANPIYVEVVPGEAP